MESIHCKSFSSQITFIDSMNHNCKNIFISDNKYISGNKYTMNYNGIDNDYFVGNLEKLTKENTVYRKVLCTTPTQQLVLMCLEPHEEIGKEVHSNTTQFIRIESGNAKVILGDKTINLSAEGTDTVIIPPGTYHNIINDSSQEQLKLYTIYSPPEHPKNTIQITKPIEHDDNEKMYMYTKNDYIKLKPYES